MPPLQPLNVYEVLFPWCLLVAGGILLFQAKFGWGRGAGVFLMLAAICAPSPADSSYRRTVLVVAILVLLTGLVLALPANVNADEGGRGEEK